MSRTKLFALSALFAASTSVFAGPINVVDYDSLTASNLVTFDDVATLGVTDSLLVSGGATFGERFQGQTQTASGPVNDVLSGTPTAPLTLLSGGANKNLYVNSSHRLLGMGNTGGISTGAVSMLLPDAVSQFGLKITGINGNSSVTFNFFRADGSLIDSQVIDTGIVPDPATSVSYFGFSREGSLEDIAGVSITNTDLAGLTYDDIKYGVDTVAAVPEPETYALMLAGLSVVGFASKRRRQNRSA